MSDLLQIREKHRSATALLMLLLAGFMALVRLSPGWNALPIFGDEAIYLRWAHIIREKPFAAQYLWVSLADPKPPLHFWLLALVWNVARDPLTSGRLLSVAAATLTIPALIALCLQLEPLFRRGRPELDPTQGWHRRAPPPGGLVVGLVAGLLVIFCPYLAFYQRMAVAESLFALEAVAVVWLSLRVANSEAPFASGLCKLALPLGLTMGAAMMTRQIVSYALWVVPLALVILAVRPARGELAQEDDREESVENILPEERDWVVLLFRRAAWVIAAMVIAGIVWSPFLLVRVAKDSADEMPVATRVFYQPQFNKPMTLRERSGLARDNFVQLFLPFEKRGAGIWPGSAADAAAGEHYHFSPGRGWYWLYLTPVLEVVAFGGMAWLAFRREWRVLALLLLWAGIMLGPLILVGTVGWSRYALGGVIPMLLFAAFLLADWGLMLIQTFPGRIGWGVAALLLVLVLAWPVHDTQLQLRNWAGQNMVASDRTQYVSGWPAGLAATRAMGWLERHAEHRPLVLITGDGWGNPADAAWVYLRDNPDIRLYYVDWFGKQTILRHPSGDANADVYLLREDKWLFTPAIPVKIADGVPVLFLSADPIYGNFPRGAIAAAELMQRYNPAAQLLDAEQNPLLNLQSPGDHVAIYRLR